METKDLLEFLLDKYQQAPLGSDVTPLQEDCERLGVPPELARVVLLSFAARLQKDLAQSSIVTLTYEGPLQAIELSTTERFLWPTLDEQLQPERAIQMAKTVSGSSIETNSIPIR